VISNIPISDLRQQSQIVIIDDKIEEMSHIVRGLRSNGFNIVTRKDVASIKDVASYDIVISDIQGVAQDIDGDEQGYGFIRQVSKNYPLKGVGVYSGISYTLKDGIEGLIVIQKDDSVQTWCDNLDAKLQEIKNPTEVWTWIAKKLVYNRISTRLIAKIEDDYVDRILNKKTMDGFPSSDLHNEGLTNTILAAARTISIGLRISSSLAL